MLSKDELVEVTDMIAVAAAKAAVTALKESKFVSDQEHANHHGWIASKIKSEEARTELFKELTKHVVKWGAIGILSFIFYGIYLALKNGLTK